MPGSPPSIFKSMSRCLSFSYHYQAWLSCSSSIFWFRSDLSASSTNPVFSLLFRGNMVSSDLISIFLLSICAIPVDAFFWNRHDQKTHPVANPQIKREDFETLHTSTALSASYCGAASNRYKATSPLSSFTFPPPSATYKGNNLAIQGMVVTATVPVYVVCNYLPGATPPASCSTVQETITTSFCSTTLTAGFDRYAISDCNQEITFSTQSSYSIVTVTSSHAASPPALKNPDPSLTYSTYVQNIVTYYVCPWRSLASGDPSGITLVICKTDFAGEVSCENIQEVWVVHTEYVPATVTRVVSVDRFFQYVNKALSLRLLY